VPGLVSALFLYVNYELIHFNSNYTPKAVSHQSCRTKVHVEYLVDGLEHLLDLFQFFLASPY
jgi:hypothetical protein